MKNQYNRINLIKHILGKDQRKEKGVGSRGE
jgi:hypothetical protein